MHRRVLVALALAAPPLLYAATVTIPHAFVDGAVASADQVNENFDAVKAAVDDNATRIAAIEAQGGGGLIAKSSAFAITASDGGRVFAVTGDTVGTLPAISAVPAGFRVTVKNTGTGIVRLVPADAALVEEATELSLRSHLAYATLVADGTNWLVINEAGTLGHGGLVASGGAFRYSNGTYAASCKEYRDSLEYTGQGSGVYWVDPDGATPAYAAFKVYCDMVTQDGGWTLVFSSQTVIASADFVTTDTAQLDTITPAGSRGSVFNWPGTVTNLAFACRNRLNGSDHFYTASYAASSMWSSLRSCTTWNCSRTFNGDSGVKTVLDLATNQSVTSTGNWRWNLGGEGQTHQYDDFCLDPNWAAFSPSEGTSGVAWGTGDGGVFSTAMKNSCAGVGLSTAGSQPTYNGTYPANPTSYTSDGYFYIWVR